MTVFHPKIRALKYSLTFLLSFLSIIMCSAQTTTLRPQIETLVSKLRQENIIHFGYPVGFAGEPETDNKYYKLYSKLKSKATNEELISLVEDTSIYIMRIRS